MPKRLCPFRKWYRRKPSYSRSGGFRTNNSISWGASPARNGRYVNQIEIPNCVNLISIFAIKDFLQVDYGGGHETLDISILKGKYIN